MLMAVLETRCKSTLRVVEVQEMVLCHKEYEVLREGMEGLEREANQEGHTLNLVVVNWDVA